MLLTKHSKAPVKKPPFYITKFRWIIFLIVILSLVAFYYFLILPQYHTYLNHQQRLKEVGQKLDLSLRSLNENKKIINNYQSINQVDKDKIDQILPANADLPDLYINLQSLVEETNLTLDNLAISEVNSSHRGNRQVLNEPGAGRGEKQLRTIEINLALSGANYLKMKKVFSTLEANLRLFDVKNFNFDPQNGHLNIIFQTYYTN